MGAVSQLAATVSSMAHQLGKFWIARFERIDQLGPVVFRCREGILVEGGSERRSDDRAVLFADAGECVAHEVDAAALDGGAEHLGCGGLQALVIISDDRTGAARAYASGEGRLTDSRRQC